MVRYFSSVEVVGAGILGVILFAYVSNNPESVKTTLKKQNLEMTAKDVFRHAIAGASYNNNIIYGTESIELPEGNVQISALEKMSGEKRLELTYSDVQGNPLRKFTDDKVDGILDSVQTFNGLWDEYRTKNFYPETISVNDKEIENYEAFLNMAHENIAK